MVTVTIIGKAYVDIEAKTDGFGPQAEKGILGAVGGIATKAGKLLAVGLGAGAVAGGGFLVKAISAASDLGETLSKVGTVFGEQAGQVTGFANQMAKDFGLPKTAVLDAAASIGLIGKASGLSQGDAAKMSTQLAKLAADASSFYNVPLPEALQAIQSGLVGEAEPMRRFGVLLNEQAVQAEAAQLGLQQVNGEYTEGAKAQARASLIMKGMTDASGDLERTQGSLANRLRELKGRAENFAGAVGTAVIPVVLKLLDVGEALGARLAPVFARVGEAIRNAFAPGRVDVTWLDHLVGGIRALVGAFQNASDGITSSGFAGTMEKIGITARQVFDAALPVIQRVASFIADNLQPILIGLGAAFVLLTSPITAVAAALIYAYTQFSGVRTVVDAVVSFLTGTVVPAIVTFASLVAEKFGELVGWVQIHWSAIQEAIGHVVVVVQTIIETFVDVVQALWRSFGDEILNVARIVWDQIQNVVDTAVSIISNLIEAGLALINGDWGQAWDAIKDILAAAWEFIRETIVNALRLAREAVEAGVSAIVGLVGDIPGQILSALGDLGSLLYDAGVAIMRGLRDGIVAGFNAVKDFVSGIAGKIADLKGPLDYDRRLLTPAGQAIMDGLLGGIKAQIPALESLLRQITAMFSVTGGALTETFPAGFVPPPDDDSFESNSFYSPNRGLPGATQAEDGSWWAPNAPQVKWPGPQATTAPATTLNITGPLVFVESVTPGQESTIAELVRRAVVELVRNGTVGQEMWKRQQAIAR